MISATDPNLDATDPTAPYPGRRRGWIDGAAGRPGRAVPRGRGDSPPEEGNGTTLIVGLDASPSDLDPQSQYDYRSTIVIRNIYEGLVGLVGSATDEFEGLVAESWEANEDRASGPSSSVPDSRSTMARPATARR